MGKTKKRKEKEDQKSVISFTLVSVLFLIFGAGVLLLFVFKSQELAAGGIIGYVYYILLIPFALSASVLLFKVVGAQGIFKGKAMGGVLELGGSAVIFVLILWLGFKLPPTPPNPSPFDFTVFLRDEGGKTVLADKGKIKVNFANDARTKKIDENGAADFKSVPADQRNKEVTVELDAPGWQFTNGKVAVPCKLEGNNKTLTIKRDDSLAAVSGRVVDEEGNFIEGAVVTIKDITTQTDKNGWFKLNIPQDKQAETQRLTVQKEGYKTTLFNVNPATKTHGPYPLEKQ